METKTYTGKLLLSIVKKLLAVVDKYPDLNRYSSQDRVTINNCIQLFENNPNAIFECWEPSLMIKYSGDCAIRMIGALDSMAYQYIIDERS